MAGHPEGRDELEQGNNSNSLGCEIAEKMCGPTKLNLAKNTQQAVVLIFFNEEENHYGAVKNEMLLNRGVFKAYGNGEYLGMSKCLRRIDGYFPLNSGLVVISFDDDDQALKCLESKKQLREPNWLGLPEIYIVPLCNPINNLADYKYLQVDMYDVKNDVNFIKYLNAMEVIVCKSGGSIVAGTKEVRRFRGLRRPMYLVAYQWASLNRAEQFNCEVANILLNSGSSCSTRVLFEMDANCSPYRRSLTGDA